MGLNQQTNKTLKFCWSESFSFRGRKRSVPCSTVALRGMKAALAKDALGGRLVDLTSLQVPPPADTVRELSGSAPLAVLQPNSM